MKVSDAMGKVIVTVKPSTSIKDLWKIIYKKRINAIPVTDAHDHLVGIITRDDLLHALYPDFKEFIADFESASDFEEIEKHTAEVGKIFAKNIMTKRIVFTRPDTQLMRAASRMIVRHYDQLPVVDHSNKIVGMITKGDVVRALFLNRMGRK